jgi:hypothetical protein
MSNLKEQINRNKQLLEDGLPFIEAIGSKIARGEDLTDVEQDALLIARKLADQIKELEESDKD